ncbi:MAG: hypothetical protein AAB368_07545, partial [bacterium]
NAAELAEALSAFAARQLPFATAVSLTRLAQGAQDELRKTLPSFFKVRGPRVGRGVTINRAEKRDWPRCKAEVGTRDEFMARQVTGGEKRPEKGAARVAIPTRFVASQRTSAGAIPARLKPRVVRSRKGAWVTRETGSAQLFLAVGQAKGVQARLRNAVLFLLRTRAKIRPRWPFVRVAGEKARKDYRAIFARELTAAAKSARARGGHFTTAGGRSAYLKALRSLG